MAHQVVKEEVPLAVEVRVPRAALLHPLVRVPEAHRHHLQANRVLQVPAVVHPRGKPITATTITIIIKNQNVLTLSNSGRGSSTSSTGGKTTTGSGVAASYGGGRYYGGGSTVPYRSGTRSTGGISPLPFVFVGASLAFWPGLWLHPVYLYPYTYPWTYHNATTNTNETKPVQCGCAETVECGCDDNNSTEYISSILGNGSYDQLNKTLVTVANVNGTDTILLNGTLPNGTTASGGTDSPSGAVSIKHLAEMAGWWPMLATTLALVLL